MSEPTDWAGVFAADHRPPVAEAGLVLSAVGIDNQIHKTTMGWELFVRSVDRARAHAELQGYWAESSQSQEQPVAPIVVDSGLAGIVGYLGVIWLLPSLDAILATDLRAAGHLDAEAVTSGEIWRTVTALTLHSDIAHIAANSVFGTIFGVLVGRNIGSGVGWLMVLLAGAIGNLINSFVQPTPFFAIGASTATFAALGLAPAFAWRRGYFRGNGWKRGFAPIFAAVALLAYTGMGGGQANIDVLGHVFGFGAGLVMGLVFANIDLDRISAADQQRAGGFAFFLVFTAWFLVLTF